MLFLVILGVFIFLFVIIADIPYVNSLLYHASNGQYTVTKFSTPKFSRLVQIKFSNGLYNLPNPTGGSP